jgi:hypothetical protein
MLYSENYKGEFEWEFRYLDWERAGPILPAGLTQRTLGLLSPGLCPPAEWGPGRVRSDK